jgi:hypothetical protein
VRCQRCSTATLYEVGADRPAKVPLDLAFPTSSPPPPVPVPKQVPSAPPTFAPAHNTIFLPPPRIRPVTPDYRLNRLVFHSRSTLSASTSFRTPCDRVIAAGRSRYTKMKVRRNSFARSLVCLPARHCNQAILITHPATHPHCSAAPPLLLPAPLARLPLLMSCDYPRILPLRRGAGDDAHRRDATQSPRPAHPDSTLPMSQSRRAPLLRMVADTSFTSRHLLSSYSFFYFIVSALPAWSKTAANRNARYPGSTALHQGR